MASISVIPDGVDHCGYGRLHPCGGRDARPDGEKARPEDLAGRNPAYPLALSARHRHLARSENRYLGPRISRSQLQRLHWREREERLLAGARPFVGSICLVSILALIAICIHM